MSNRINTVINISENGSYNFDLFTPIDGHYGNQTMLKAKSSKSKSLANEHAVYE